MSIISLTKLYDFLITRFDKETAENFTSFVENKIKEDLELKTQSLATKEDLAKLEVKMGENKVDIIKWIFAFWVTIVLMFIGLYLKK